MIINVLWDIYIKFDESPGDVSRASNSKIREFVAHGYERPKRPSVLGRLGLR